MRDQEIVGLWEAYSSIYSSQEEVEQLDEGRNTSLRALSRESQKRKEDKERGRPETKAETHGRLMMGKFRPGASKEERAEGGRERLRDRGKVPQKGGKDMFEHILEHLVAEGYADTNEAAIAIMANMSEEWRQSIGEMTEARYYGGRRGPDRNAVGGADRDGGRNRYLGSPTPRQAEQEGKSADAAAKRAVEQSRRRRAAERAKNNG
jgi:hypothetical protein